MDFLKKNGEFYLFEVIMMVKLIAREHMRGYKIALWTSFDTIWDTFDSVQEAERVAEYFGHEIDWREYDEDI